MPERAIGIFDSGVGGLTVLRELRCEKRLEVVPQATHLFEEPGALDAVAHLAGHWFVDHDAKAAPL